MFAVHAVHAGMTKHCVQTWAGELAGCTCPVSVALMRKYVDTSIGQRTPLGMYTNDPSEKTAEFKAAK